MSKLSFQQFLKKKFPWFEIDPACETIVHYMNLWAWRDEAFEKRIPKEFIISRQVRDDSAGGGLFTTETTVDVQSRLFLDKGFCLIGNVGSGKTILLHLLNCYLLYIGSPYAFSSAVIPEVAARIEAIDDKEIPLKAFAHGNCAFDEMAKQDSSGQLNDEKVNMFGKISYLSDVLVHRRHLLFTKTGFQSHYTTNHNLTSLSVLFDERFISRLLYQCNIFTYTGDDRRINARPVFFKNMNVDYSDLDASAENFESNEDAAKNILEEKYQNYLEGKLRINSITYQQLSMVGIQAADQQRWTNYLAEAAQRRKEDLKYPSASQAESAQKKLIVEMYATGKFSEAENAKLKDLARSISVRCYFEELKGKGFKKVFDEHGNPNYLYQ